MRVLADSTGFSGPAVFGADDFPWKPCPGERRSGQGKECPSGTWAASGRRSICRGPDFRGVDVGATLSSGSLQLLARERLDSVKSTESSSVGGFGWARFFRLPRARWSESGPRFPPASLGPRLAIISSGPIPPPFDRFLAELQGLSPSSRWLQWD